MGEKVVAGGQKPHKKHLTKKQLMERKKRRRKKLIWRAVRRFLLCLFTIVLVAVFGLYEMLGVVFLGPSQTMGDTVALSMFETSALKFVPGLFYSEEELDALRERNKPIEPNTVTDTTLVTIKTEPEPTLPDEEVEPDIYVDEISGPTFKGWMLVVKDPSRVSVGVANENFTEGKGGMKIGEIVSKYDAVAGINGGAFEDSGGTGNGGMPSGVTFAQGKQCNSKGGSDLTTAGFTNENVLVVGKFTKAQAKEMGLRDAVSFGPALIVNNEPVQFPGVSSGLNPRTAIGQRADGAVLMLVIDGRQVNSMGASYADLVDIMVRYGAVNACNLDGGSSSNMIYQGEMLNDGVAITGSRRIPTAFIVSKGEE